MFSDFDALRPREKVGLSSQNTSSKRRDDDFSATSSMSIQFNDSNSWVSFGKFPEDSYIEMNDNSEKLKSDFPTSQNDQKRSLSIVVDSGISVRQSSKRSDALHKYPHILKQFEERNPIQDNNRRGDAARHMKQNDSVDQYKPNIKQFEAIEIESTGRRKNAEGFNAHGEKIEYKVPHDKNDVQSLSLDENGSEQSETSSFARISVENNKDQNDFCIKKKAQKLDAKEEEQDILKPKEFEKAHPELLKETKQYSQTTLSNQEHNAAEKISETDKRLLAVLGKEAFDAEKERRRLASHRYAFDPMEKDKKIGFERTAHQGKGISSLSMEGVTSSNEKQGGSSLQRFGREGKSRKNQSKEEREQTLNNKDQNNLESHETEYQEQVMSSPSTIDYSVLNEKQRNSSWYSLVKEGKQKEKGTKIKPVVEKARENQSKDKKKQDQDNTSPPRNSTSHDEDVLSWISEGFPSWQKEILMGSKLSSTEDPLKIAGRNRFEDPELIQHSNEASKITNEKHIGDTTLQSAGMEAVMKLNDEKEITRKENNVKTNKTISLKKNSIEKSISSTHSNEGSNKQIGKNIGRKWHGLGREKKQKEEIERPGEYVVNKSISETTPQELEGGSSPAKLNESEEESSSWVPGFFLPVAIGSAVVEQMITAMQIPISNGNNVTFKKSFTMENRKNHGINITEPRQKKILVEPKLSATSDGNSTASNENQSISSWYVSKEQEKGIKNDLAYDAGRKKAEKTRNPKGEEKKSIYSFSNSKIYDMDIAHWVTSNITSQSSGQSVVSNLSVKKKSLEKKDSMESSEKCNKRNATYQKNDISEGKKMPTSTGENCLNKIMGDKTPWIMEMLSFGSTKGVEQKSVSDRTDKSNLSGIDNTSKEIEDIRSDKNVKMPENKKSFHTKELVCNQVSGKKRQTKSGKTSTSKSGTSKTQRKTPISKISLVIKRKRRWVSRSRLDINTMGATKRDTSQETVSGDETNQEDNSNERSSQKQMKEQKKNKVSAHKKSLSLPVSIAGATVAAVAIGLSGAHEMPADISDNNNKSVGDVTGSLRQDHGAKPVLTESSEKKEPSKKKLLGGAHENPRVKKSNASDNTKSDVMKDSLRPKQKQKDNTERIPLGPGEINAEVTKKKESVNRRKMKIVTGKKLNLFKDPKNVEIKAEGTGLEIIPTNSSFLKERSRKGYKNHAPYISMRGIKIVKKIKRGRGVKNHEQPKLENSNHTFHSDDNLPGHENGFEITAESYAKNTQDEDNTSKNSGVIVTTTKRVGREIVLKEAGKDDNALFNEGERKTEEKQNSMAHKLLETDEMGMSDTDMRTVLYPELFSHEVIACEGENVGLTDITDTTHCFYQLPRKSIVGVTQKEERVTSGRNFGKNRVGVGGLFWIKGMKKKKELDLKTQEQGNDMSSGSGIPSTTEQIAHRFGVSQKQTKGVGLKKEKEIEKERRSQNKGIYQSLTSCDEGSSTFDEENHSVLTEAEDIDTKGSDMNSAEVESDASCCSVFILFNSENGPVEDVSLRNKLFTLSSSSEDDGLSEAELSLDISTVTEKSLNLSMDSVKSEVNTLSAICDVEDSTLTIVTDTVTDFSNTDINRCSTNSECSTNISNIEYQLIASSFSMSTFESAKTGTTDSREKVMQLEKAKGKAKKFAFMKQVIHDIGKKKRELESILIRTPSLGEEASDDDNDESVTISEGNDSSNEESLDEIKEAIRIVKKHASRIGYTDKELVHAMTDDQRVILEDESIVSIVGKMTDSIFDKIDPTSTNSFFDKLDTKNASATNND